MKRINAVQSLRESIRILEIRQAQEAKALKEQLASTYESLKPVNLFRSTLNDIISSFDLKDSLVGGLFSAVTAFLAPRIEGSKNSLWLKLLGVLVQYGVSRLVPFVPPAGRCGR